MCGRFTQTAPWEKVKKEFTVKEPAEENLFKARYNIAPTQLVPVVRDQSAERIIANLKWGLVPS